MDFKSLLSQLDQLNEAEGTTVHKGTYGTSHGKEDVRDQYGHKIGKQDKGAEAKKDAPKKGRGRPKKGADDSGEVKSYDFSAFGVNKGKDVKLPKHDKKKTIKHSLKEYLDQLDKALNEEYTTAPMPGAVQVKDASGKVVATAKSPQAAEMFKKGDVTLGNPDDMKEGYYDLDDEGMQPIDLSTNPPFKQLVNRYTQLFYQGHEGSYDEEESAESDAIEQYVAKRFGQKGSDHLLKAAQANYGGRDDGRGMGGSRGSNLGQPSQPSGDFRTTKAGKMYGQDAKMMKNKVADRLGRHPEPNLPEGDIGKHNNATTGFDAMVRELTPKYGVKAAKRIAGAQLKKIREADMPPNDSLASPLSLEEGKKTVKKDDKAEKAGKKVTKDLEYDMKHKGKDDAKDFKELSKKKKVKEGMEHKLKAARHTGKAHALSKQGYNCGYDDMEESRHYHEGYKEGLDECYGQMTMGEGAGLGAVGAGLGALAGGPIGAVIGGGLGGAMEEGADSTVDDMASYGAHTPTMEDDMYEMDKTSYMKQQAVKTPGNTFKAFGQTFKDKEVLESPFAFEAWEKELNSILEGKDVTEGMTVSISKGQQGSPDSVTVSAQDGEADQLLSAIKQAGLGLFGGDEQNGYGAPQGGQPQHGGLDVVGDHDGMMALIKKVGGGNAGAEEGSEDYADEEGHGDEHGHEGTCESCGGMMEAGHSCDEGQEMVDEVESEDQMEYEVAEEIDPNNSDEANEVNSDAVRDAALATAASTNEEEQVDEDEEEAEAEDDAQKLDEWANDAGKNGTDTTFEQDIDFMTKVISGGLNKQKSTGQSTIPVVSSQLNRLGNPMQESVDLLHDWRKLSGIK